MLIANLKKRAEGDNIVTAQCYEHIFACILSLFAKEDRFPHYLRGMGVVELSFAVLCQLKRSLLRITVKLTSLGGNKVNWVGLFSLKKQPF